MNIKLLFTAAAYLLTSQLAVAQSAPTLLKDINTQSASFGSYNMDPSGFCQLDGITYFTGYAPNLGRQLWRTDGSSAGTRVITNNSGLKWNVNFSTSFEIPASLTAMNGSLYFFTANEVQGGNSFTLNRSDTSGNTVSLASSSTQTSALLTNLMIIQAAPNGGDGTRKRIQVFNNNLYFAFSDASNGVELWKSNGTTGGTSMLKDLTGDASSSSPQNFTVIGSTMYFTAASANNYVALWKTNGTAAGTVKIKDSVGSTGLVRHFTVLHNKLYFMGMDNNAGNTYLWQSDGSAAGTIAVAQTASFGAWIRSQAMKQGTSIIYTFGSGLMKYDGATSSLLSNNISMFNTGGHANHWVEIGNVLYFAATNVSTTFPGVWKTDGTSAGTVAVLEQITSSNYLDGNGTLFFAGNDNGGAGMELWKSNGTAAGTVRLSDFNTNTAQSGGDGIIDLTAEYTMVYQNGRALISAYNGLQTGATTHSMLASSDGTVAGTGLLAPGVAYNYGSYPAAKTVWNNAIYFSAYNVTNGDELWKTDGTPAGTVMIKDLNPGPLSSYIQAFTPYNGSLYFLTTDSANGYVQDALWKTDGTTAGTIKVKDSLGHNYFGTCKMGVDRSVLFITAGGSVYISDGTAAGTVNVPIKPTPTSIESIATNFAFLGNTAVLSAASNGTSGSNELWNINLTAKTASRYTTGTIYYPEMCTFDGAVYFARTQSASPTSNYVLWKTDGTLAGTSIADIAVAPHYLTVLNNGSDLYYVSTDAAFTMSSINRLSAGSSSPNVVTSWNDNRAAAYVYDNVFTYYNLTAPQAPATYIQSLYPSTYDYFIKARSGGPLFMPGSDLSTGIELYTTDGTSAGTTLVKNIWADSISSYPQYMTRVVNKQGDTILAFVANDGVRGAEIWLSDRTSAGTQNLCATLPGSNSLDPKYLTFLNNKVIFWGTSVEYGTEPYAFEMYQVLKTKEPVAVGTGLTIYPNPAGNTITVCSEIGSIIQVYTIAGVKVAEATANADRTLITVSNLAPGLYTVSVTGKDGRQVGRFVKQ